MLQNLFCLLFCAMSRRVQQHVKRGTDVALLASGRRASLHYVCTTLRQSFAPATR